MGPIDFTAGAVQDRYFRPSADGVMHLTDAGEGLYRHLRDEYLAPAVSSKSPTLYMTGGLPGGGKSTVVSHMLDPRHPFVRADSDLIKLDILSDLAVHEPGLKAQIEKDPDWGDTVHPTSQMLVQRLMVDALASGKDVVYDSSMCGPDTSRYEAFAQEAHQHEYAVQGMILDITPETSLRRWTHRAEHTVSVPLDNGTSLTVPGRRTTPGYEQQVTLEDRQLHANVAQFVHDGVFDKLSMFDNNTDGQPAHLEYA